MTMFHPQTFVRSQAAAQTYKNYIKLSICSDRTLMADSIFKDI